MLIVFPVEKAVNYRFYIIQIHNHLKEGLVGK